MPVEDFTFILKNQTGTVVRSLSDILAADITIAVNRPGNAILALADDNSAIYRLLREDYRLTIIRKDYIIGQGDWLVQRFRKTAGGANSRTTTVYAAQQSVILDWPIVAYNAATSQALKTNQIDDMMKEIIKENLGASATDTDRDMTGNNFTVEGDKTLGPSRTAAFSRQRVLPLLQKLSDLSRQDGTPIYFDVVNDFQFRTYLNQRGINRTGSGTAKALTLSLDAGTLSSASVDTDYYAARNYIYAGGGGQEANRNIQTASDSDRINNSIWGRVKEAWFGNPNLTSDASILAEANAQLWEARPVRMFEGEIANTPDNDLGTHWTPGDRVLAELDGETFTVLINPVTIRLAEGQETITAPLRSST